MYCRRSSDTEDRQVQSIDAQKRELLEFAKEHGLEIVQILEESQSAKAPGRPVFTNMIERINRGEADGLLVWKLNRLARNPIDGGTISWMLQQRIIKHIQTYGNSFYPDDNVIVMAVELGMANQYIKDLSTDTKRGIRERVDRGYPNGVAPIGFKNDLSAEPGARGWLIDEDRFNLMCQLLEVFLTGTYSVRKLMAFANDKLGLRTKLHKKQGGKKLVASYIFDTILKNPVYAGFFFTKDGIRHELNADVPRMISEDQYWEIQKILGNRGRPRASKNILGFAYTGPTRCGGCSGSVTAEHKYQLICSECKFKFSYLNRSACPKCKMVIEKMDNPLYLHYIYYHCTRKKDQNCREGSVQEVYIDGYLSSYYKKNLEISESLSKWCIENLDRLGTSDHQDNSKKKLSLEKTLAQKESEQKELARMKARHLLEDDEFLELKKTTMKEIDDLREELQRLGHTDPYRIKKAQRAFNLAVGISKVFENGTIEAKRGTLSEIGSNLTLKEKKLGVSNVDLYSVIINGLLEAKAKNPQFEPENIIDTSGRNEVFASVCSTLLRE